MLTKTFFLASSVVAAILIFPVGALAAEGVSESSSVPKITRDEGSVKPHIGLMAGYLGEIGDTTVQDGAALLDVGIQMSGIETSAQFQYAPGSISTPGGGKVDYDVADILLKVATKFGGDMPLIRDSYIGAKSGAVLTTTDSETKTFFGIGGTAGFDIPVDVASGISLGAEGTYLAVIGENIPDQASVLGAMKYWF